MVIAVRTEQDGDDLVVVKQARSDGDVARLSAEAEMLNRARHPGVVELLAVEERALRLRHGGTSLARLGPFPVDVAAGIVSAVADIIDAIHRLGVAHGDLDADHVLLDRRGRPRLCGFGRATDAGEASTADDVAALGYLLRRLLDAGERLPWHQPPGGLRRRAAVKRTRRELDILVNRATHSDRTQRPTARQFAKAIHAAVPQPVLPDEATLVREAPSFATLPAEVDPTADLGWTDADLSYLTSAADDEPDADPFVEAEESEDQWRERNPDLERARIEATGVVASAGTLRPPPVTLPDQASGRHEPPPPPSRRATMAAVFAAVAVTGIVGGAVAAQVLDPFGGGGSEVPGATTTTTEATTTTAAERTPPPYPTGCTRVPDPGPDATGDGCPEQVQLDGREATIGSVTVTLGDDGDEVLLGDWNCDGTHTPAVFRPSTGEVFVFPRWSLDEPIEIEAIERDPDATGIRSGSGACPDLLVETPAGDRTIEIGT